MSASAAVEPKPQRSAWKFIRGVLSMTAMIALLFVAAGRLNWSRGWIFVALFLASMIVMGTLLRLLNPATMRARMAGPGKDTKPFDRIFLRIFIPLVFLQPVVAALDAVRFRWTAMPFAAVWPGALLLLVSTSLMTWAMVVNPHAEMSVRIQTDRGHRVITTGPYRFVRHPMYVGMLLMYCSFNLILGTWWAFVVVAAIAALVVWRTAMEDRTLMRELPGYSDFAAQTRWRLLPGLW